MLASHWLLLLSIIYQDGHSISYDETVYQKDYCKQQAQVRWNQFYREGLEGKATMTAICRNARDHYDFFSVICDRNGVCKP